VSVAFLYLYHVLGLVARVLGTRTFRLLGRISQRCSTSKIWSCARGEE
ncbi:dna-directed rna polymerase i polypeptide 2, partial [Moniliophthora roreri]